MRHRRIFLQNRLLAALLALVFCIYCVPVATAESTPQWQEICISNSTEKKWYKALIVEEEVYLPALEYASITNYHYQENEEFLGYTLGDKSILIEKQTGIMQIPALGIYENSGLKMAGIEFYEGYTYLSMAEILPWLNVDVSIQDGEFLIVPDDLSFWELTAQLDSNKYLFDLCEDFGDSTYSMLSLASMITFDLALNLRWDMIYTGELKYTAQQYKETYISLATNDALSSDKLNSITEGILTANKNISTIEKALGIDEAVVDEKITSMLFTPETLKALQQYTTFATYWRDIRSVINVASEINEWMQPLKLLKIHEIYLKDVSDYTIYLQKLAQEKTRSGSQLMGILGAVLNFRDKGGMIADQILTSTGKLLEEYLRNKATKKAEDVIFKDLKTCFELAGIFYSTVFNFKQSFSGITDLGMYSSIATQSWLDAVRYQNAPATQKNLLMICESYKTALKASKKCFENIEDLMDIKFFGISVFEDTDKLMDYRIDPIDEMLVKLSAAAVYRENDSIDHKEAYKQEIRQMLQTVFPILPPASGLDDPAAGATAELKTFFYENFSPDDKVVIADVTHDGINDMIVIIQEDEWSYECILCIGSETNEMTKIQLDRGGNFHAGGFFNIYIRQTEDGFSNLGRQSYNMWQGYGTLSFDEYYLDSSGNIILVESIEASSPSNDIPISNEEYQRYESAVEQAKKQRGFYTIVETESLEPSCPVLETDPEVIFSGV